MIRPFKKAEPRKSTTGNRRKGKTQILTDTPVKAELEARQKVRESKTTKRKKDLFDSNQPRPRKTVKVSQQQKPKRKKKTDIPTVTSDDKTPCHLCGVRANVLPLEDWRECPSCNEWFHERCCPEDSVLCYACLGWLLFCDFCAIGLIITYLLNIIALLFKTLSSSQSQFDIWNCFIRPITA